MSYDLRTRNGHNMYDMSSMLQKSIRRCNYELAGYAAMELFGRYWKYLWRRLIVISAEDCYGVITREIISLYYADLAANQDRKGYDRDPLFVAKAITLLCTAKKNRDACYFACNFMLPDRVLNEDEIEHIDITKCKLNDSVPEWVFDYHTYRGRANGKRDLDMVISEQEALTPKQISLFDNEDWSNYFEDRKRKGQVGPGEWNDFLKSKEQCEQKKKNC